MATPNERKTDLECKKLQYEIDDLKGWWKKSVFEKVCLALILVGVGFAIDYGLKRFQGRVSYQESLFAKRRESYQAIALKAQIARDRVLYLHSNRFF